MIYLDNNATTRPDPAVIEAMKPWLDDRYGNPSAGYRFGKEVRKAIEESREKVATLIGAHPEEIVFTSGGTESNNAAISSAVRTWPERKRLLTSAVEHSAVFETMGIYADLGFERVLCPVDAAGNLDLDEWRRLLRETPSALASLIWANNETGVLGPIDEAAAVAAEAGVLFHSDAVQAVGKIAVDVGKLPVQALSMSAHKFHGPKGIGALYVNRHTRFAPLLIGGGQEANRRSGTENAAAIVGMGIAAELAGQRIAAAERVANLRDRFEEGLLDAIEGVEVNGRRDRRLPNTSNLHFPGVDGEGLLILLDEAGICCSPGSACSTGSVRPSRILLAMGQPSKRARGSVRFSLSHLTTAEEIEAASAEIVKAVAKLRIHLPSRGRVRVNTR